LRAYAGRLWKLFAFLAASSLINTLLPGLTWAVDITTSVVSLAGTNKTVLYTPRANANSHIGIFVMHPSVAYSNFPACSQLASRGFTMLCADSIFTNRMFDYKGYEDHAPAITAALKFLRNQPGITKILVMGHGMGGPMMAFYDWVQENGTVVCGDPRRLLPCDTENLLGADGVSVLQPVDGLILFDADLGDAFATFTQTDPAIGDPDFPGKRNSQVDMFAAQNGYPGDAAAASPTFSNANYNNAFLSLFLNGQASRNADALRDAQRTFVQMQEGDPQVYSDDMPFEQPGVSDAAQAWRADLDLLSCSQKPHVLLKHDGTNEVSAGPICSVRIPSANSARDNSFRSDIHASVRVWLGAHALRTSGRYELGSNDITGVDYGSSNTSAVIQVQGITRPTLIIANGGSDFIRFDEIIFDNLKSADKSFVIEEGSSHDGAECKLCEQSLGLPLGFFGDAQKRTYDFIAGWLRARF
jgi:hypothetical protein